jgi:hypothetical protein
MQAARPASAPSLRASVKNIKAVSFLGAAKSVLGAAESVLGDDKSSLGDAKSSLGDTNILRVTCRWPLLVVPLLCAPPPPPPPLRPARCGSRSSRSPPHRGTARKHRGRTRWRTRPASRWDALPLLPLPAPLRGAGGMRFLLPFEEG